MILSASRRTDIPAFYGEWFMNRLREGFVLVRNPMNPKQISRIDLDPSGIDCIVFWTKNPKNFLPCLDEIDRLGYSYYFQFTVTPYGNDLEPGLPEKSEILNTFIELSKHTGKEKIIWRYDPVIINKNYTPEYHFSKFDFFCNTLKNHTEKCVISFIDRYTFLDSNFKKFDIKEIETAEAERLLEKIVPAAASCGITVAACAEKIDLSKYGVHPNRCIDADLIGRLFGSDSKKIKHKKDPAQRTECNCSASRDIGTYNTCIHGCVYCYAKRGTKPADYDPLSPILGGTFSVLSSNNRPGGQQGFGIGGVENVIPSSG
jgi:hypothetical protein